MSNSIKKMLYFVKRNDRIEKYQISFDKEQLKNLVSEIVCNCSYLRYCKCKSVTDGKEYYDVMRTFPDLVELLGYIDDGYYPEIDIINEILNYDINNEKNFDVPIQSFIDYKINLANQELNNIDFDDITKKEEIGEQLKILYKEKELNVNQQRIDVYYGQLMEILKIDFIDSIPIGEWDKLTSFLNFDLSRLSDLFKISYSEENPFVKSLKI